MKITAARLHRYRLPLRAEWQTAAGDFAVRAGWLLEIATANGLRACGDCAPLTSAGTESPEVAGHALHAYSQRLVGMCASDALTALPDPAGCPAPAARCAAETALLDLMAQAANLPLARYLQGAAEHTSIAVNAALGNLMRISGQDLIDACGKGFSILKLKVGTVAVEHELPRLRDLAAQLPTGSGLRLDANRAWHAADAERFIDGCRGLPIEMLEEPLNHPLPPALHRLQSRCAFPLALDESLAGLDPSAIFATPSVRRLVLKPPRCGGLLPALALARQARLAGLDCIVTSSVDSACGVLAAAHLAAALDNGLAHGLATSSWLAADTGTAPLIAGGRLMLPAGNGLGFVPQPGFPD